MRDSTKELYAATLTAKVPGRGRKKAAAAAKI
jgi:hypothetical protein